MAVDVDRPPIFWSSTLDLGVARTSVFFCTGLEYIEGCEIWQFY